MTEHLISPTVGTAIPPKDNHHHQTRIAWGEVQARADSSSSRSHLIMALTKFAEVVVGAVILVGTGLLLILPAVLVTNRSFYYWDYADVTCDLELDENERINCYPERPNTEEGQNIFDCNHRGCCYLEVNWDRDDRVPDCFFPKDTNVGYRVVGAPLTQSTGYRIDLERIPMPHRFRHEAKTAWFTVDMQTEDRLHFKMAEYRYIDRFVSSQRLNNKRYKDEYEEWDRLWKPRYEVPQEAFNMPKVLRMASERDYIINYTMDPFHFKVIRKKTGTTLFDTSYGGLINEDHYLEVTTRLPSANVYGFSQMRQTRYRHELELWKTWPMFTLDSPPDERWNSYGQHPFYMVVEDDGNAFGVFLLNSNAQDVSLQPLPSLTWRTTGGVFDFWMFLGPKPEDVIKAFTEAIGRPEIPPYWALGYQLSHEHWGSLEEIEAVAKRNRDAEIPVEAFYSGLDYMDKYRTFTYDTRVDAYADLPKFINDLHMRGQKYIITLLPTIPNTLDKNEYPAYHEGIWQGVFVNNTLAPSEYWKWEQEREFKPTVGKSFSGECVFVDFTNPRAKDWWAKHLLEFHKLLDFDGIMIDYNEPSNMLNGTRKGCENTYLNYPPYAPNLKYGSKLFAKTLCMDSKQTWGDHYDVHSLYGHSSAQATHYAGSIVFANKRPMVVSRSTFSGTGKYAAGWLGHNRAEWDELFFSIHEMLRLNINGIPFVGADICGYYNYSDEELCTRWHQLGSFYPLMRNHNSRGTVDKDPASYGEPLVTNIKDAMDARYSLLPYLYTLFYHARYDGNTVARPIFHEFPLEEDAWEVDWQFMWGPALLITPVLEEGKTTVNAYIPDDRWYDYYLKDSLPKTYEGRNATLPAPIDKINLHIRGGYIIPTQEPGNTTYHSRKNYMGLIVALPEYGNDLAVGDLFWDDGEAKEHYERREDDESDYDDMYLYFEADENQLRIRSDRRGLIERYPDMVLPVFTTVTFLGVSSEPSRVVVDNNDWPPTYYTFDRHTTSNSLTITNLRLEMSMDHEVDIGGTANP